jgi:hypothetical protein
VPTPLLVNQPAYITSNHTSTYQRAIVGTRGNRAHVARSCLNEAGALVRPWTSLSRAKLGSRCSRRMLMASQDDISLPMYVCLFCRGSRSRSTSLTRYSLLTFSQLPGLVIRHPPSPSPTVLLLTSTNHFTVPFLHSTFFSAIDTTFIGMPPSPEPRCSSARLCLALRPPRRSTSIPSSSQHSSLYLAIRDVRKSFPVASFVTKVSHVPTSAPR